MATFVCEGVGASRQCEFCGSDFVSPLPQKRFCNRQCKKRASYLRGTTQSAQCYHCGIKYRPKRTDRNKFCSRECNFKSKAFLKAGRKPRATPQRHCRGCGVLLLVPSRQICDSCIRPAYTPARKHVAACVVCEAVIIGRASKRKCERCIVEHSRRLRKHRKRASHYGVRYEPINTIAVFERDGWRCQVCGVRTPRSKRGTFADNAPELDHRVPMSRGGPHTWDNVQCCCRSCNIKKGNRSIVGQMNLFCDPMTWGRG